MLQVIKQTKLWLGLSTAFVLASLALMFTIGFNPSADFVSGTTMKLSLANNPHATDVREYMEKQIYPTLSEKLTEPDVRSLSDGRLSIRTSTMTTDTQDKVKTALSTQFGAIGDNIEIRSTSAVFATEFMLKSLRAIAYTSIAIIIYLAISFRNKRTDGLGWHIAIASLITLLAIIGETKVGTTMWVFFYINLAIFATYLIAELKYHAYSLKFGIVAIVTLLHDVLIVCSIFILLGLFLGVQVDGLFITALLMIIGHSVNDTIVVFDRVRENVNNMTGKDTFAIAANRAVNQTIARSVNTSFTVFITLTALFVFGPDSIRFFVLALMIGVVTGTYSSIFVATPLLTLWQKK